MITFVKGQAFLSCGQRRVLLRSLVPTRSLTQNLQLQQDCSVKVGSSIYSGKVAAIGKCYTVSFPVHTTCTPLWEERHALVLQCCYCNNCRVWGRDEAAGKRLWDRKVDSLWWYRWRRWRVWCSHCTQAPPKKLINEQLKKQQPQSHRLKRVCEIEHTCICT